ncbi:HAD-IB family hydrolase [Marivirga sp.]|uniref:HAD-IB family hydrolase n=1 Tax=Marivirga sp. TaxID=2018662 RepID=UPI003DA6DB9F
MSKSIAFFDFDGTLTKKDTFLEFLKFEYGKFKFYWGFTIHAPFLIAMKLKLYPNWKAKEKILSYFLKGKKKRLLERSARSFCDEKVPGLLRKSGLEQLKMLTKQGVKVYIVSASASLWVKPWTDNLKINLIATELEDLNGKLTGKISGKNCYGPEKVKRIRELENLEQYEMIYTYGDSIGDKEMLKIADKSYYKPFRE